MRALVLSLLLALAAPVWATEWFACPDSVNTATSNGTNYATDCFDGDADIAWGSINPGDTVYLCGDWLPADTRITVEDSGSSGLYITLSGNAQKCGRTTNSTISREGLSTANGRAIAASNTAATRQYIKIEDLTLKHCSDYCLLWEFSTTGAVTDDTALWVDGVTFEDCGSTACLRHTGMNLVVQDSIFDDCPQDCVWNRGQNITVSGSRFQDISSNSITGDGIQTDATGGPTDTGDMLFFGNYIDHSDVDVKYCLLVTARGVSNVRASDNYCECPPTATNATPESSCHGITVDLVSTTVLRIERNEIVGGDIGIQISGNAASTFSTRGRIIGNVLINPYRWGILTDGYINNFDAANNSITGASDTALDFRKNGTDNTDAIDIGAVNNLLMNSGIGMSYVQTPSPRGYNSYFGNDLNIEANGSAGSTTTGDLTSDPRLAGGSAPTSADGFCLQPDSPLLAAGTYIGAYATGYNAEDLGKPPVIGARGLCRDRQPAATRPSAW